MTRALALAVAALALTGCASGGAQPSTQASYAANPSTAALVRRAALQPCPGSERSARGGGMPAVTLPCLGSGGAVNLAGLRGSPTVVNVWAAWCVPCQAETPLLVAAAHALGNRVRFLGVDTVDGQRNALDFAAHVGMHYPSVVDEDKKVLLALRSVGPPLTAFVRVDGRVAHVTYGQYRTGAALRRDIATYLGVGG